MMWINDVENGEVPDEDHVTRQATTISSQIRPLSIITSSHGLQHERPDCLHFFVILVFRFTFKCSRSCEY